MYSLKSTPAKREAVNPLSYDGSVAQAINFGGSSFRFSFVLPDGTVHEFCEGDWGGYFGEIDNRHVLETIPIWDLDQPSVDEILDINWVPSLDSRLPSVEKKCGIFVEIAAQMIHQSTLDFGLEPDKIKRLGITTPGVVDKDRKVIVKSNNIELEDIDNFDFFSELYRSLIAIDCRWKGIKTYNILNDAEAGVLGELAHPDGFLTSNHGQGVAIDGTGFGGQLLIDGKVSKTYCEFGYVLVRNEALSTKMKPQYEFIPLDETFAYYEAQSLPSLRSQLPGKRFLETVAGGEWSAIHYAKEVAAMGMSEALFAADSHISQADFDRIVSLRDGEELCWNTAQLKGVIGRVGKLRVELGHNKIEADSQLIAHAREFDLQLAREIGAAFLALRNSLYMQVGLTPDEIRIALVSSVFEGHKDDAEWIATIRDFSGLPHLEVSTLSQNVREAFPHGAEL